MATAIAAIEMGDPQPVVVHQAPTTEQQIGRTILIKIAPRGSAPVYSRQPQGQELEGGRAVDAARIAVEMRQRSSACTAAGEGIQIAVTVIVHPGHGAVTGAGQRGALTEATIALVPIEQGHSLTSPIAAIDQQIDEAIAIIIAPGQRAAGQPRQPNVGGDKGAIARIAIENRDRVHRAGNASERQIYQAVVVVVAPSQIAIGDSREGRVNGGKAGLAVAAAVVTIEPETIGGSNIRVATVTGEQQIEIAIVVIVGPSDSACGDIHQGGVGVGKAAAIVAIEPRCRRRTARVAGEQQIGIAVAVIVTPGRGAALHLHQCDTVVWLETSSLVGIKPGERLPVVLSAQQEIKVAIQVMVGPGQRAPLQQGQADRLLLQRGVTTRHAVADGKT